MSETTPAVNTGDTRTLTATRMAHGGEAIARDADGRVVFIRGAYPGDTVTAEVTEVKKRFARAHVHSVEQAGDYRGQQRCPAAAQGAGCCDFGDIDPSKELELKTDVLLGQLSRVVDAETLPTPELIDLTPHRGWRTRVRLGVDEQGRAGTRKLRSHDLVTDVACTQVAEGLLDGVVGPGARTFTPGSEIIVARDGEGKRHIVETRKARRGSRVEKFTEVVEGGGTVTEHADGVAFSFPPTAFWQAHAQAPEAYTSLVRRWLADLETDAKKPVAWDLYGGVGLFVPALGDALGDKAQIFSVDYSKAASGREQEGLADYDVERVNKRVDNAVGNLPAADVVLLDPPRTGAGDKVVELTAQDKPARVIHVGCDPATFTRDAKAWLRAGYAIDRLAVINAFPGTHHFEVIAELTPEFPQSD